MVVQHAVAVTLQRVDIITRRYVCPVGEVSVEVCLVGSSTCGLGGILVESHRNSIIILYSLLSCRRVDDIRNTCRQCRYLVEEQSYITAFVAVARQRVGFHAVRNIAVERHRYCGVLSRQCTFVLNAVCRNGDVLVYAIAVLQLYVTRHVVAAILPNHILGVGEEVALCLADNDDSIRIDDIE